MRGSARTQTICSAAEFENLSGWDDLVRSMPRPSPFLLRAWLLEWWRHFGEDAELSIHVATRDGRLVGALPHCLRKRHGLVVTEFIGGKRAALADLMVLPGEEPATATGLAGEIGRTGHDYADLFGMPGASRLAAALPPGSLRLIERIEAPVLDLRPGWDSVYNAKLSKKARSDRRRRRRKLEALGAVDVSIARTSDELQAALGEAFSVHARRWRGRRDTSGFATPAGMRFHRSVLLRLAEQDVPRLVTLRLRGWAIAFALYLQLEGRLYGLIMAFDPAFARFAPGSETLYCALETAASEGVERVEFLGAAAEHKQRFTDRCEPIYEGIGLASTVRGRAAAEALVGGIRVRRRLKRSPTAQRIYQRVPLLRQT